MRYTSIIERGPINFSAYAGCLAADDTEEEAVALIKEALAIHVEDLRRRGKAIPRQTSFSHEVEVMGDH